MRPLRLILLIAILPGLLLPGGFVWRLCRCAAMSAQAVCCVVEVSACCCEASPRATDGGSTEQATESRPECTCGVIATPEREPANEPFGTGVPHVMVLAAEPAPVMAPLRNGVHVAHVIARAQPPPDATRSLPLLI